MWRSLAFAGLMAIASAGFGQSSDLKALEGKWEAVTYFDDGNRVSLAGNPLTATFKGGHVWVHKNGVQVFHGLITLDDQRMPPKAINTWHLDGVQADHTVPGIYQFKDDHLEICFGKQGVRPKNFWSGPGEQFVKYKQLNK